MAIKKSTRVQTLVAETVRCAFREAFNASVEAAAREAPSSTLDKIVSEFLQAWRREGENPAWRAIGRQQLDSEQLIQ